MISVDTGTTDLEMEVTEHTHRAAQIDTKEYNRALLAFVNVKRSYNGNGPFPWPANLRPSRPPLVRRVVDWLRGTRSLKQQ